MALSVLSGLSIAELAAAVAGKDAVRLTKIPGVGKKTAERLLLELQGKFAVSGAGSAAVAAGAASPSAGNDIVNALIALGYSEKETDWAAKQLPKDAGVSDGIRQALKLLSKS
jgi:Holliday junction DNA helicase RuvA